MPGFDGDIQHYAPKVEPVDEVRDIIVRARELLSDPKRWCKGTIENEHGAMCAIGALWRSKDSVPNHYMAIRRIQQHLRGKFIDIPEFNDAKTTTHEMVLALLDKAAKPGRASDTRKGE